MLTPQLTPAKFIGFQPHRTLTIAPDRFAYSRETIAVGQLVYCVTGHYTVDRPGSAFPPAWIPAQRWPAEVLHPVTTDGIAHLCVYSHSGFFEVQARYGTDWKPHTWHLRPLCVPNVSNGLIREGMLSAPLQWHTADLRPSILAQACDALVCWWMRIRPW